MAAYESHGETDEWYTPKYIFDALGVEFDLDVASPQNGPRHVPAKNWFWGKFFRKKMVWICLDEPSVWTSKAKKTLE